MPTASVESRLRIVTDFKPGEYEEIRKRLASKLDRRLSRWNDEQVELELSVKDRDTPQQRVTLECWVAESGRSRFVATSTRSDLMQAVSEVGEDLHRQIDRFVTKREDRRR